MWLAESTRLLPPSLAIHVPLPPKSPHWTRTHAEAGLVTTDVTAGADGHVPGAGHGYCGSAASATPVARMPTSTNRVRTNHLKEVWMERLQSRRMPTHGFSGSSSRMIFFTFRPPTVMGVSAGGTISMRSTAGGSGGIGELRGRVSLAG